MHRVLALAVAAAVVASCTDSVAPSGAPTGPAASPGAPSGSGSTGSATLDAFRDLSGVAPGAEPTLLAAAEAELATRDNLREQAQLAAALGETGPAVLAADGAVETAFGEQSLGELAGAYALDLTAAETGLLAAAGAAPPAHFAAAAAEDGWTGSLIGATSFTLSMYMGFAPQLFPQAGGKEFRTQPINRNETHDREESGVREHLVVDQRMTVGTGGGRVVMDVTLTSTSVLTSIATGTEIARRSSTSVGHFELNGCPSETGAAEGRYSVVNQEEVTRSVGSNGGASKVEGPFTVFNGDDAHLIRTDFSASVAAGAHGPATAGADAIDWGATATFPVSIPAQGGVSAITIGDPSATTERNVTPRNANGLVTMLLMAGNYLGDAAKHAETFWRSGECIEMKTSTESKTVDPSATVEFTVDPIHKFDGAKVKAPVKASFSGKQRLDPSDRPQDPPAQLRFSAGNEEGDKGTVQLEQVGKRGIGKKTLEFTVGISDYRVDVSAPGFGFLTGVKCHGREGQWVLSSSGSGTNGTITFLLAPGQDGGEAHAVYDLGSGGGAVHWDLFGVATFVEGNGQASPPMLRFGTMTGTATVRAGTQTITTPYEQGAFDVPLQTGKFCT